MKVSSRKEVVGKVPAILSIVSGFRKYCCHKYVSFLGEESIHVLKFWLLVWFWWVWFCLSLMKTCARVLDPISDSKSYKNIIKHPKKAAAWYHHGFVSCNLPAKSNHQSQPIQGAVPRSSERIRGRSAKKSSHATLRLKQTKPVMMGFDGNLYR